MSRPAKDPRERAWQAMELGPFWLLRGPDQSRAAGELPAPEAAVTEPVEQEAHSPEIEPAVPVGANESAVAIAPAGLSLPQLQQEVSACRRCGLCESRQQTVFGTGDPAGHWLIIGEAPGANEDRLGEPFVGEAGRLLDAMLGAVGISRQHGAYIVNVLKCRPPANRDPLPVEVASCRPYLEQQINLLKPRLILTMGRFAAQVVLQTDQALGALRGRTHEYTAGDTVIPVVVGYHPAYLLGRPQEKARAWADLCLARSLVDPASAD